MIENSKRQYESVSRDNRLLRALGNFVMAVLHAVGIYPEDKHR